MIIATTSSIEGHRILEYRGLVFGEVISGVHFLKDIGAAFRDAFGGRSSGYEDELIRARTEALHEMESRAAALDCNAVIGVTLDYEVLGQNSSMLMVTASGTAVRLA